MATVWLGLDNRLARRVAIKIPSEQIIAEETFSIRFEREAQIAASLSHPHLVSVYDYGFEGERPYLISEFVDGSEPRGTPGRSAGAIHGGDRRGPSRRACPHP